MTFSNLTKEDIPDISKIFMNAFNAPPWNDQWTLKTAQKRLYQMFVTEEDFGLIYETDGKNAAFILGREEQYCNEKWFTIKEFCTDPQFQGKGFGKKLFEEFEKRLKEKGINKIFLVTLRDEKTSKVYENLGFEECVGMMMMEKEI